MTLPLSDLDIPVLVPSTRPLTDWEIVQSLTNVTGRTQEDEHWSQVTVGARDRGPGASDWQVTSVARRGMRPLGPHGDRLTTGPTVSSLAISAVGVLLTRQRSDEVEDAEDDADRAHEADTADDDAVDPQLAQWRAVAEEVGEAFSILPGPDSPWRRDAMIVDGQEFARWVHERAEGTAAVADLGPCVVSMGGTTPPAAWTFTLLTPDRALSLLTP